MAVEESTPASGDGGAKPESETVWVVANTGRSRPVYHTEARCPSLVAAANEDIRDRDASQITPTHDHCTVCAEQVADSDSHESECSLCGAEGVILPRHLRDDCPQTPDGGDA